MQVSHDSSDGPTRTLEFVIPRDQVDTAINSRLRETAKTIKLKGFRNGKVPFSVIKNRYGRKIRLEVINALVSQHLNEVFNRKGIRPAGPPAVTTDFPVEKEDADLVVTAIVEVHPEFELPDFSQIRVESPIAEITEADIDNMVEDLREQKIGRINVSRGAIKDDLVKLDYECTIDGKVIDSSSDQSVQLNMGTGTLLPGFEEAVSGRMAGEEFEFGLTLPDNYHDQEVAGAKGHFKVKILSVSEPDLPELNEDFFKLFGIMEGGMEAFRKAVTSEMRKTMEVSKRTRLISSLSKSMLDLVNIHLPQSAIQTEIINFRQRLKKRSLAQNFDWESLPDDAFLPEAERRLKISLIIAKVLNERKITLDHDRVRQAIEDEASTYEDPATVAAWISENKEELIEFELQVLEDQVFDHILEEAVVVEKIVPYTELVQPKTKRISPLEYTTKPLKYTAKAGIESSNSIQTGSEVATEMKPDLSATDESNSISMSADNEINATDNNHLNDENNIRQSVVTATSLTAPSADDENAVDKIDSPA
ncbi:MAG: trigger factor [Gammaproteobacteria bacterium]|nr:trigger factor [Gammaproteobacteria bacterium]